MIRNPVSFIGQSILGSTSGSILFADSTSALGQDNTKLFWDDTNNRVGIGTTTPSESLDLNTGSLLTIQSTITEVRLQNTGLFMKNIFTGGGWARALLKYTDTSSVSYTEFGGFGSGQNFTYGYWGQAYNNAAIKIVVTDSLVGVGLASTTSPSARLHIGGPVASASAWGLNGVGIRFDAATYTDTTSIAGTVTNQVVSNFGIPTIAATNAVTYTNSANVYISGPPAAGSNATLTNKWSLWVDSGDVRLDGSLGIGTTVAPLKSLDVRGSAMFGRTSLFNSGRFASDSYYSTDPGSNNEVGVAVGAEIETANDSYAAYQSIGVQAIVRYGGSFSESSSNKGVRALDANMFVSNTATTQHAAGMRMDIRNISTGTVTNLYGNWVPAPLNSGGGTITNLYGLKVDAMTTGTNNYGVHLSNVAAAGRWNLYCASTANSYFAGAVGIGVTPPVYMLDVSDSSATVAKFQTSSVAGQVDTVIIEDSGNATAGRGPGILFNVPLSAGAANGGRIAVIEEATAATTSMTFSTAITGTLTEQMRITSVPNILFGTTSTPTSATYNLVLGGGTTSPVLGAIATDRVSLAAVDKAAADRRLYIQSESGSSISIGNNRLNFTATTGYVAQNNTDILTITSDGLQVPLLSVGAAPNTTAAIFTNTNLLTGTTQRAFLTQATANENCTVEFQSLCLQVITKVAAFTLPLGVGVKVLNGVVGAGSNVTTQIGVDIAALSIGDTNNYGIRSIVASSATGAYNLFISGTAPNYLAGNLGVGTTPLAYQLVRCVGSTSGNVAQAGLVFVVTGGSDATNAIDGIAAQTATTAASYTCATVRGLRVNDTTVGAGSTITTQVGVDVLDQTGGTNIYGFRSQVTSGSNKWGLYASGTAPNYMAGNLSLGTTTASARVHSLATTEQLRLGYDTSNYVSYTVSSAGSLTIANTGTNASITLTPVGTGQVVLSKNVTVPHIIGSSTAPTIAAGAGAGTAPTVSVSNATDLSGIVNVTTGTLPTGTNAVIVTITFNVAYGVAPNIALTPANALTAALSGATGVFCTSTTTTFVIDSGVTALTAATAYKWFYMAIQ